MKLAIRSRENDLISVSVAGTVTQKFVETEVDPLCTALGSDAYRQKVMLDLSDVASLDSSGVNWLLLCHKRMLEAGGKLALHSLSPICRNVIRVLNLQSVFRLAETEADARAVLKGEA